MLTALAQRAVMDEHSRPILRREAGQGSVEWIGLITVVAIVVTVMAAAGASIPGISLVHSVSRSMLCAASLSEGCFGQGSLDGTYGDELAGLVRENTPDLLFGPDLLGLPVDFRSCRSPSCADAGGTGVVSESTAGEPVTLFTRVIDCRSKPGESPGGSEDSGGPDCSGEAEGSLYIQYWAYYPESASLRGVPVLEGKGFHRHDWESAQVRIDSGGKVDERASSHAGYNHSRSAGNWGSDMGSAILRDLSEAAGFRTRGGWGPRSGTLLVAGGSHAGNVAGRTDGERYPTRTPAAKIRLVPLEQIQGGPLVRPADFDPITPPWAKEVWESPESEGTG